VSPPNTCTDAGAYVHPCRVLYAFLPSPGQPTTDGSGDLVFAQEIVRIERPIVRFAPNSRPNPDVCLIVHPVPALAGPVVRVPSVSDRANPRLTNSSGEYSPRSSAGCVRRRHVRRDR
jgi:hypothetical protein